jgi:hypothetical protein
MAYNLVVKGRLISPTTVELENPVTIPPDNREVEVVFHPQPVDQATRLKTLIEHFQSLPLGTRTKEDIDRQIQEERDSWE